MVFILFLLMPFLCFSSYADGGYMGMSARYEHTMPKNSMSGIATNFSNFTFIDNATVSMSGLGVGFFAGYGRVIKNIYLGLEMGAVANGISGKKSISILNGINNNSSFSAGKDYSVSLCARLGTPLNDKTLAYIKGGGMMARYRLSASIQSATNGVDVTHNWDRRLVHMVLGAGIEHTITPIIRLGLEYENILGRPVRLPISSSTFQGDSQFHPMAHSMSIRIIFGV